MKSDLISRSELFNRLADKHTKAEIYAVINEMPTEGATSEPKKKEPKDHHIKILPEFYEAIERGDKNFEIRKNDRNYAVGDFLTLEEWDGEYTGRGIHTMIKYIYEGDGYGLSAGWCVLALTV